MVLVSFAVLVSVVGCGSDEPDEDSLSCRLGLDACASASSAAPRESGTDGPAEPAVLRVRPVLQL
jgi:hypothetical protein